MVQQANETPRRAGLIGLAAAGLTLAVGVTVGGLLGWIRPPEAPTPTTLDTPSAATIEEAAPPPPAASPAPPQMEDPAAEPEIEPAVLAMERPIERREHHARREHHRESREHGEREDGDED